MERPLAAEIGTVGGRVHPVPHPSGGMEKAVGSAGLEFRDVELDVCIWLSFKAMSLFVGDHLLCLIVLKKHQVFVFITTRTQVARPWSKEQSARLTAVCNAHSLGTRFCSKFPSVSDVCTPAHSATLYKTPGVTDMVRSLGGDCW